MAKKRAKKRAARTKKKVAARAKKPPRGKPRRTAQATKKAKSQGPLAIGSQHVDFLTYKSSQLQKFYGEVLELKTEFRDVDGLAYLMVRTSPSSSIGFMPPHPEMKSDQPPPREPSLYFVVDDVDRAYEYLVGKGVTIVHPPETMPWGHRVLTTTDPEGRTVMIAAKVAPED
jgi:predicted enzyme related to lactoylglutathione lyase